MAKVSKEYNVLTANNTWDLGLSTILALAKLGR